MNIYQKINQVMQEVTYVQKDKQVSAGQGGNYKAVTHDQLVSVARAAMVKAGIVIVPRQISGELFPQTMKADGTPSAMRLYSGMYEIDFVSIDDGNDKLTVIVEAHANDNGDKAPGKALTYATKSAVIKVLWLETGEGEESRVEVREEAESMRQKQLEADAMDKAKKLAGNLNKAETQADLDRHYAMAESIENLPQAAADRLAAIYTERTKMLRAGSEAKQNGGEG